MRTIFPRPYFIPGNIDDSKSQKTEPDEVVRGRVKTEKKSDTFNLPWTPEEQKK